MSSQALISRLGLVQVGDRWRGDCPSCGYGNNAFMLSFNRDGSPNGWCVSCQDRDAIDRILGTEASPVAPVDRVVKAAKDAQRLNYVRQKWLASSTVIKTPAELYLKRRCIPWLKDSAALRYSATVSRPDTIVRYPAMIAAVVNVKGELVALHRTYLQVNGKKATGEEPVKASVGLIKGGAIRLEEYVPGHPLVIGEGIETAASAGKLVGAPCWAAVSAGNLEYSMRLPKQVEEVIIAADPGGPGENAAWAAYERWEAEGKKVKVILPDGKGDFNDVLMAQGGK